MAKKIRKEEFKTAPLEIWQEYQKGVEYLTKENLYQIVKTNENFYDGRQWEGVKTEAMQKPVINVLQRVVKYMIATLCSNDVAVSMIPFTNLEDDIRAMQPISEEVEHIVEHAKIKEASRLLVRNGAVDGSGYMMQSFNPDYETGQDMKGCVENQLIDNTNVYFGNPYSNDIQNQPYIIIAMRQHISQVKREARSLGVSEEEIENIKPDNDQNQANDDSTDLVTILLKYYKQHEMHDNVSITYDLEGNPKEQHQYEYYDSVWFTKTTKEVALIKPTDLGYKRYPISCFGWDTRKNSYTYNSPLTSVIPNQVFINKCYAIAMQYGMQSAFPKVVYDKNKIDIQRFLDGTSPSAVAGIDMMGKFLDFIKVPDFSNNILQLVQDVMQQTKECMGVNDASLGNVNPDNTSAIVALQEATNVPLEIQKNQYYAMWEDTIRNIIDIMACTYGTRQVMTSDNELAIVDFSVLNNLNFNLRVDVGNGSQYSEVAQINTLDKLVQAGFIDQVTYLEAIPNKYLPQKSKIVQRAKEIQEQQMQQMAMLPPEQM